MSVNGIIAEPSLQTKNLFCYLTDVDVSPFELFSQKYAKILYDYCPPLSKVIKDDILRVENDPDDESRLNLTINRKPIADWFREQWHRLRYGARVPQQEERKSRGFKL